MAVKEDNGGEENGSSLKIRVRKAGSIHVLFQTLAGYMALDKSASLSLSVLTLRLHDNIYEITCENTL